MCTTYHHRPGEAPLGLYGKKIAYRQLVRAGRALGFFSMQDRHLWEGAFAANRNGTVRVEEAVEPEIAAMAICRSEDGG